MHSALCGEEGSSSNNPFLCRQHCQPPYTIRFMEVDGKASSFSHFTDGGQKWGHPGLEPVTLGHRPRTKKSGDSPAVHKGKRRLAQDEQLFPEVSCASCWEGQGWRFQEESTCQFLAPLRGFLFPKIASSKYFHLLSPFQGAW